MCSLEFVIRCIYTLGKHRVNSALSDAFSWTGHLHVLRDGGLEGVVIGSGVEGIPHALLRVIGCIAALHDLVYAQAPLGLPKECST